MALLPELLATAAPMARLRRDLHAHPELCFEELRTSDLVAAALAEWGVEVHRGLGRTGVVGIIHGSDGGKSGKAVGLRADMDALPMQESNTFEHASRHAGRMHACGHDGHTAMLLAAVQYLAAHRDSFEGTVYAIFQPAEEGGGGAREMIADGLFTRFPMQAVFGMHNWPGMKAGTMAVGAGPAMASSNEFKIVIRGKGGHAAMPHMVVDPVPVGVGEKLQEPGLWQHLPLVQNNPVIHLPATWSFGGILAARRFATLLDGALREQAVHRATGGSNQ